MGGDDVGIGVIDKTKRILEMLFFLLAVCPHLSIPPGDLRRVGRLPSNVFTHLAAGIANRGKT